MPHYEDEPVLSFNYNLTPRSGTMSSDKEVSPGLFPGEGVRAASNRAEDLQRQLAHNPRPAFIPNDQLVELSEPGSESQGGGCLMPGGVDFKTVEPHLTVTYLEDYSGFADRLPGFATSDLPVPEASGVARMVDLLAGVSNAPTQRSTSDPVKPAAPGLVIDGLAPALSAAASRSWSEAAARGGVSVEEVMELADSYAHQAYWYGKDHPAAQIKRRALLAKLSEFRRSGG